MMHLHLNRSFVCGFTTNILPSHINWEILTITIVISTIVLFVNANRGLSRLPPGPLRWPVIGNLGHVLIINPRKVLRLLHGCYGDVFRLYLGKQLFVVVSGYNVLHETIARQPYDLSNNLLNVPSTSHKQDIYNQIVPSFTSKSRMHAQSIATLKHAESAIECQVKIFASEISKVARIPIDIYQQLFPYLEKTLCTLTKTFTNSASSDFDLVQENMLDWREMSPRTRLLDFFQTIKPSFNAIFTRKFCHILTNQNTRKYEESFQQTFHQKKRQWDVDQFRQYSDNDLLPTADHLMHRDIAFSAFSLSWSVLYLVRDKHLQGKLRQEIISVVGKKRYPCKQDLKRLPLCQSFLLEVIRHSNILPFSVTHRTFKNTSLRGFLIPEGTIILLNLDSVMNDNNIFSNPREFKPDRFIGQKGEFLPDEKLTSLTIGNMHFLDGDDVQIVMLMFLTTLIQRFELLATDNKNVHTYTKDTGNQGIIYDTKHFKIRTRKVV